MMKSCDSMFSEISKYNDTYQSKFLLSMWSLFGTITVMFIHIVTLSRLDIIMKIVLAYGMGSLLAIFFPIIFTASSINHRVGLLSENIREDTDHFVER